MRILASSCVILACVLVALTTPARWLPAPDAARPVTASVSNGGEDGAEKLYRRYGGDKAPVAMLIRGGHRGGGRRH